MKCYSSQCYVTGASWVFTTFCQPYDYGKVLCWLQTCIWPLELILLQKEATTTRLWELSRGHFVCFKSTKITILTLHTTLIIVGRFVGIYVLSAVCIAQVYKSRLNWTLIILLTAISILAFETFFKLSEYSTIFRKY